MITATRKNLEPLLYESHMHTPLCKHAYGLPGEYAEVARQRGLKGIIVTCHSPMPEGFSPGIRMHNDEWPLYLDLIQEAAEAWAGEVEVLPGLESDYFPGYEGWLEKLHARTELNHVLGSVHPHTREYIEAYDRGTFKQLQANYFNHLADAAETGLFDTLAHPDLVKNQNPKGWDVKKALPVILKALDRIAATGVAMELNTSGLNKAVPEMNPGPQILWEMASRDIPVVIGADAHVPDRCADHYEEALHLLDEAGYREVSYFIKRQRRTVTINDALASLRAPASSVELGA
jgi:histidinol-phosphatase (PHP family)